MDGFLSLISTRLNLTLADTGLKIEKS